MNAEAAAGDVTCVTCLCDWSADWENAEKMKPIRNALENIGFEMLRDGLGEDIFMRKMKSVEDVNQTKKELASIYKSVVGGDPKKLSTFIGIETVFS